MPTVTVQVDGSSASTTVNVSGALQPLGVPGTWTLQFDEEFTGTSLSTNFSMPGYVTFGNPNTVPQRANVSVGGGVLTLTLSSVGKGAMVSSAPYDGATTGWLLPVGGYAEARVLFPGSGATIYNWPGWWASGPGYPNAGENDIAEGLGTLTVNYHSASGAHNHGTVPGNWGGAFHVYGIFRGSNYANVYYDGALVKTYTTDDNGGGQALLLTAAGGNSAPTEFPSHVQVDYVRGWVQG